MLKNYLNKLTLRVIDYTKAVSGYFSFFILKLFKMLDENIWLIGGSLADYYDDNAKALYRYIKETHPEVKLFWIVNRKAPDLARIQKSCNILYKNTIKTNALSLNAKVIITTHSLKGDISLYPPCFYNKSLKVHIFHGIHAFKKKSAFKVNIYLNKADILIASGPEDKRIKNIEWGIAENKIKVTGLPQHDNLLKSMEKSDIKKKKSILYFPTWRDWLFTKKEILTGDFSKTDYFMKINDFLFNERLRELTVEYDIDINFMLHRNNLLYKRYFDEMNLNRSFNLIFSEKDYQKMICETDLLITDYSSMAFDFLLLDKPVFYYQFDQRRYIAETGSYVDFNTLPNIYLKKEELVDAIADICRNNFQTNNSYEKLKSDFIKYSDNQNSKRVFDLICSSLRY